MQALGSIEAARALYAGHAVSEISRSDAGAENLTLTTLTIDRIIAAARQHGRKALCFVTGVPGAGKTLVGLDVATRHRDTSSALHSVFLSGMLLTRARQGMVIVVPEGDAGDPTRRSECSGTDSLAP